MIRKELLPELIVLSGLKYIFEGGKLTRTSSEKLTLLPAEWRLPLSSSRCKICKKSNLLIIRFVQNQILNQNPAKGKLTLCLVYYTMGKPTDQQTESIISKVTTKMRHTGEQEGRLKDNGWLEAEVGNGKCKGGKEGKWYEPGGL